jgi:hypothetical protein
MKLKRSAKPARAVLCAVTLLAAAPALAQPATPADGAAERRAFDFLIGTWTLVTHETAQGVDQGGDDVFTFRPVLDGDAILSEWYFNRGTKARPDYTHAHYLSAFDPASGAWSFYYVSPRAAQYYEGRKEDGQWYFYKEHLVDGKPLLQRQSWRSEGPSTLIRRIENSTDGGRTWVTGSLATLKRRE